MASRLISTMVDKPGWVVSTLFFLLVTGPPKFRSRDLDASVRGEVDFAIFVQIAVYVAAFAWCTRELYLRPELRKLSWTHRIAAVFVGLIATSCVFSLAPAFTASKAFEIGVLFCFTMIFVARFGVQICLDYILKGMLLICLLLTFLAIIAPQMVLFESESGIPRLRGWTIAESGPVAAIAVVLLLCSARPIKRSWFWLSLSSGVLFFSLTRTAWGAVGCILVMILVLRPRIWSRKVVFVSVIVLLLLIMGSSTIRGARDESNLDDFGGRSVLWIHMADTVLTESPWLGLGYAAGTRVLAMEVDPDYATGHSIFFEVFIGAGILGLVGLFVLIGNLLVLCTRMIGSHAEAQIFTAVAVFCTLIIIGALWEQIDSTPFGFTFWAFVSIIPRMRSLQIENGGPSYETQQLPA
jgi:O-antigen ligase